MVINSRISDTYILLAEKNNSGDFGRLDLLFQRIDL
jgi:hypothetical protein